jgi:phosphatidylserine/phosphatidylglycerophosphate/cardiolipin synthase-like enzyme
MTDKWNDLFKDASTSVAEFLIDGVQTFEDYVTTIQTANAPGHYIYVSGWMLDVDFPLTGKRNPAWGRKGEHYYQGDKTLLNLLETAGKKGVEVRGLVWRNPLYLKANKRAIAALNAVTNARVYIDDYNFSPDSTKKVIALNEKKLKAIIAQLVPYLEMHLLETRIREAFDVPPSELLNLLLDFIDTKNLGAHHEKNLVVKGQNGLIAYCGGLDINENRFESYHDSACKLVGPAAHAVLERFVMRWKHRVGGAPLAGEADVKPKALGPVSGQVVRTKVVTTFNSRDGRVRDRSLKKAYLEIIDNARNYIYIEDQYLVNLEVAQALNKKLRDPWFKLLIMVIQDSRETTDIMIPDRKRGEFFQACIKGLTKEQRPRCQLFMINDDLARSRNRHPGLHSKTLIVDDELAIIGSGNVNQRSMTLDSEVSVIVFNQSKEYWRDNFAFRLRQKIWEDLILKPSGMTMVTWEEFVRHVYEQEGYSLLRPYAKSIDDLDDRLTKKIKPLAVPIAVGIGQLAPDFSSAVEATSVVLSPIARKMIIDMMFDHLIDPSAD